MSEKKELDFFLNSLNYPKGLDWYKRNFITDKEVRGETSPNYSKYPGTAALVAKHLPDAKLIYIIRDPVERLFSEIRHYNLDPNIFIKKHIQSSVGHVALETGKYYSQIKRYLKFYPKSKIHVVSNYNLMQNRVEEMEKVFRFLGLDGINYQNVDFSSLHHQSSAKIRPGKAAKALNKYEFYKIFKNHVFKVFNKRMNKQLKTMYKRLFYDKTKAFNIQSETIEIVKAFYADEMKLFTKEFGEFPDLKEFQS